MRHLFAGPLQSGSAPWSDSQPIRAELFGIERFREHAHSLARSQTVAGGPVAVYSIVRRLRDNARSLIEAYTDLHRRGFAHSVESWQDGELAGGLYGLWLAPVFFGESMFSRATDASKVALVKLVEIVAARGARLIDCQQATPHLGTLGARPIPRKAFSQLLQDSIQCAPSGESWADAHSNGQT